MSLLDRRTLILAPLALAACGFEPVYGTSGPGQVLQNQVLVDAPNNQNAYLLTREIEERLGRAGAPTYALSFKVTTNERRLAIDSEGDTGRFHLVGVATYSLRSLQDGQIVTSGSVENFTGYSATGTTVATLAGEQDAQKRLMNILADQIVTRLYAVDFAT